MPSLLQNTRRPDITFNRNGRIDITARVARLLNIQPGDVIDVVTDASEHYLRIRLRAANVVGRHEAQCFPTYRRASTLGSYRAWSRRLAHAVFAACGAVKGESLRLPCGEPIEVNSQLFLPLIIHHQL